MTDHPLLDRWLDGDADVGAELSAKLRDDAEFARVYLRQVRMDELLREALAERAKQPGVASAPRRIHLGWLCAAAVLLTIGAGSSWWWNHARQELIPQRTELVAGSAELIWTDGSRVTLAPGTQVRWPTHLWPWNAEPSVELLTGNIVAHIARQPPGRTFAVHAGSVTTRVLGTAFALARQAERTRLVVTEGRVAMSSVAATVICEAGTWCEDDRGQLSQRRAGTPPADGPSCQFQWPRDQLEVTSGEKIGELLRGIDYYPENHGVVFRNETGLAQLTPGCRLHLRWRVVGGSARQVTCWLGTARPASGGRSLIRDEAPDGIWHTSVVDPYALELSGDAPERMPLAADLLQALIISTPPTPGLTLEVAAIALVPGP